MPEIFNNQRKIKLELAPLDDFINALAARVKEARLRDFATAFVSDRRMRQLNKQFRGKSSTTDVLSFPYEPEEFETSVQGQSSGASSGRHEEQAEAWTLNENYLGDIVISAGQAERQAKENGLTLENEIKQLILHGLLHLCGYDHETDNGEMNARELELREKLGI